MEAFSAQRRRRGRCRRRRRCLIKEQKFKLKQ